MKNRAAAIPVFLLWAVSAAHGQTPRLKNPLGTGPDVVAAGHTIYNRTCTACHGVDGGEGERGQAINAQPMTYMAQGRQYVAIASGADIFGFTLFQPELMETK